MYIISFTYVLICFRERLVGACLFLVFFNKKLTIKTSKDWSVWAFLLQANLLQTFGEV